MKKQVSSKATIDVFGKAISAYYLEKDETPILVHSPDFDDDEILVPYLFRDFKDMPPLEQAALEKASGRILDVGCGAGSHSLFLQNVKKLEVTAIDISEGALEICKARGIKNARNIDYFDLKDEKFDTILLLMNGTGIIEKLENLDRFFQHSKTLLSKNGQILIDSSDLSYLFDPDEDGGIWIDPDAPYYGELEFSISYKGERSSEFNWLYLDYNSLALAAEGNDFSCELVEKGEHFDYLAVLKPL
ncbi:class I SAM-dependent methyltransferase [Gillisia hiemivivida]|uniref:Class I SAM-dependent methyltransferase n=1 Tax=Gillisia hiemivivida TaxID=291190 RepID=A0A5C6ZTS1_9FLAO|nr:class I SAM-dependent methyltransferase [Gillisia hiemivivida]TXD92166.1 class I SAM-dependent methyltransferase [Gillisia hiemivivida]